MFEPGDKVYFCVGKGYLVPYSGFAIIRKVRYFGGGIFAGYYLDVLSYDKKWNRSDKGIIVDPVNDKGAFVISEEIYNSPLYKALKEDEETA